MYHTISKKAREKEKIITAYVKKTNNPNYGRPKTGRDVALNIKISKDENEMLNECVALTGRTKTDVVAAGTALVRKEFQKDGE